MEWIVAIGLASAPVCLLASCLVLRKVRRERRMTVTHSIASRENRTDAKRFAEEAKAAAERTRRDRETLDKSVLPFPGL